MSTRAKPLGWAQTTIDRAISLRRLIQITRAARDVELRSPAKQCPECGESVELIVIPSELCGSCWSNRVIANWRVVPEKMAVVSVRATQRMRRRIRMGH